ncbi:MAG: Nif3-like dinuclear metal center hexameric protein [Erysipelotrichaceae bacterium]|nr:Nif3-like dinuclear metal center hexameric protein [Erysipelotrichaceae bacterium]
MKIREVVDRILDYHPHLEGYKGCDDYKCGDPDQECTGIVTALTPNVSVIRRAIELGANLIVVHEPTFHTSDDDGWSEEFENSVLEEKLKLLKEHGIVIWRDHDHMHAHQPDSIFTGVLKYLGWEENVEVDTDTGMFAHYIVKIPEMSVKELAGYLIDRIGLNGARIVGDPEMKVTRVALVGHLFPNKYRRKDDSLGEYSVKVIETLEKKADVIIPGEVIDWTVLSYVRDATDLGIHKAAINIGHFNWEELGMMYMRDWLDDLLDNEIRVVYVASGDMYRYVKKGE